MDLLPIPHCIVEIDGRRFDSRRGEDLISSSIELTADKTGEGSVELYDPDFQIIDGFLAGGVKAMQARFWFGWGVDLGNSLFVGNLQRVEWSDRITTFRFHDHSAKMKKEKKTRYHNKKSDLKILKDLAEENGLKFAAPKDFKESEQFGALMQAGRTDWEFALKVATRSGLKLYVRGDTLFAVETGTTQLQKPVDTLIFEKDFTLLRGFNLSYKLPDNKKGRPKKTEIRNRAAGGKVLKGQATTGGGANNKDGTTNNVVNEDLPQPSVALLTRAAKGKTNKRREYAFEHQLKTLPTFRMILELRNTLTLAGMGKFYSGDYIVTEIRYSFRPGELVSELTVGRDIEKRKK
jgi:hypothetical protein